MAKIKDRQGQAQIEFFLVIVLFLMTIFGTFEVCRLLLSFTTLANASRVGVRYATTHGASYDSSTYVADSADVTQIVRDYAAGSMIDPTQMTVTTTWLAGTKNPGDLILVQVQYPYQPFVLLPMQTNLATQTEGIITF
jgi:Flp pilus assembly protein TadG